MKFVSSYLVVMRTSNGPEPPVNGCTDVSNRPVSNLKPIFSATARQKRSCAASGNAPGTASAPSAKIGCCSSGGASRTVLITGASSRRSSPKISVKRSLVMPRSN